MAKYLRMTEEMREECQKEFQESVIKAVSNFNSKLGGAYIHDGKLVIPTVNFTKTFNAEGKKATVYIHELAWIKMYSLVQSFSTEVAWHGIAHRDPDEEKDAYYMTDVLVYPQLIAGATVESDDDRYEEWTRSVPFEQYNEMLVDAHSHVNMSVSPSQTDLNNWKSIMEKVPQDGFYIFMIWNKSGQHHCKVYDLKKNILFENEDVDIVIGGELIGLDAFIKDARDKCKSKVYTYQKNVPAAAPAQTTTTPPTTLGTLAKTFTPVNERVASTKAEKAKEKEPEPEEDEDSAFDRIPERSKSGKFFNRFGYTKRESSLYDDDDDDDYDDLYGYKDKDKYFDSLMRDPFGYYDGYPRNYYGGEW